jgi:hypothetical protein
MPIIGVMLIGFVAGLFTMTIIGLYRWFFKVWNKGIR